MDIENSMVSGACVDCMNTGLVHDGDGKTLCPICTSADELDVHQILLRAASFDRLNQKTYVIMLNVHDAISKFVQIDSHQHFSEKIVFLQYPDSHGLRHIDWLHNQMSFDRRAHLLIAEDVRRAHAVKRDRLLHEATVQKESEA